MATGPETIKHRRYDPSMSKRTRKPQVAAEISVNQGGELAKDSNSIHSSSVSSLTCEDEPLKVSNGIHHSSLRSLDHQDDELQNDSDGIHRSSLKELMNQGNKQKKVADAETDQVEIRAAMSEDKNSLALVPTQGDGMAGAKKRGMVNRYVKMLSHLIKVKRESKKKSVVPLLKL